MKSFTHMLADSHLIVLLVSNTNCSHESEVNETDTITQLFKAPLV